MGKEINIAYIRAGRIALQHAAAGVKRMNANDTQRQHYLGVTLSFLKSARAQLLRALVRGAELQYIDDALILLRQPAVSPIYIQGLIQKSIQLLFILEGTLQRRQRRSS